jgi:hypothetical protein
MCIYMCNSLSLSVRTPYVWCIQVPQPITRPHLHNTPNHTRDSRFSLSLALSISLSRSLARSLARSLLHDTLNQTISSIEERARELFLALSYTHTHLHDLLNQTISSKHENSVSPVSTSDDSTSSYSLSMFFKLSEHLRTTLFGFPAAST